MAEAAEAGGYGRNGKWIERGGDMGEREAAEGYGRKGRKRSERGRGRLRAKGELHTAAVKNTVERRFKALDNLADTHILREGWIYFEFLTERQ